MAERMTHDEALAELKDIAPLDIGFWQALLEWLLVWGGPLLLVGLLGWLGWRQWRRHLPDGWQHALRVEIQATLASGMDAKEQASRLNLALKRAAVAAGYRAEIAPLAAEEWFDWLLLHTPPNVLAQIPEWQKQGAQLVAGLYAPLSAGFHDHALTALRDLAEGIAERGFISLKDSAPEGR